MCIRDSINPENSMFDAIHLYGKSWHYVVGKVNGIIYDYPYLIVSYTRKNKHNKITYETDTISDDLIYTIDGIESKYSFFQISEHSVNKINVNNRVGSKIIINYKWITHVVFILCVMVAFTSIVVGILYYLRWISKFLTEGIELEPLDEMAIPPTVNDPVSSTFHLSSENKGLVDPYA